LWIFICKIIKRVPQTFYRLSNLVYQNKQTCFVFSVGPRKKPFQLQLVADNSTFTKVDMGELGGLRDTIAEFKDNSLISYLHNNNKVIDIMAVRTVNPQSKNLCYNIFRKDEIFLFYTYVFRI
jgi:hypothetical protein